MRIFLPIDKTISKRAEQGMQILTRLLMSFMGVFSIDFANVDVREELCYHSRPKKQIREAYFNRITAPKKSRAKNNTNSVLEFVLFTHGAERGICKEQAKPATEQRSFAIGAIASRYFNKAIFGE